MSIEIEPIVTERERCLLNSDIMEDIPSVPNLLVDPDAIKFLGGSIHIRSLSLDGITILRSPALFGFSTDLVRIIPMVSTFKFHST